MALVILFVGSLSGILIGAFQFFVQGAGLWAAFSTYLGFSFGFPFMVLALALVFNALRPAAADSEGFGFHKA